MQAGRDGERLGAACWRSCATARPAGSPIPSQRRLATALAQAVADPATTERRGRAGRAALDALGLTWPRTVERLLS